MDDQSHRMHDEKHDKGIHKASNAREKVIVVVALVVVAAFSLQYEVSLAAKACQRNKESARVITGDLGVNYLHEGNYTGPETIFQAWPKHWPFPCVDTDPGWKRENSRKPTKTGLMYVREMKTGSSTLSGVLLRLAHTRGEALLNKNIDTEPDIRGSRHPCRIRLDHAAAFYMQYQKRDREKSYLMTMLRDPTKRAVSQYFHFRVSKNKEVPTDKNFQNFFTDPNRTYLNNYYIKSLSLNKSLVQAWKGSDGAGELGNRVIQDILDRYNFIGITERMDESLVVLKMLLRLTFKEILYMTAKSHGTFSVGIEKGRCIYIVPSFLTPFMNEFFQSNYWHSEDVMGADMKLYKAASKSLDNTINALGRREVNRQVQLLRNALEFTHKECKDSYEETCSSSGEFLGDAGSTCYMWNIGCGYSCINDLDISSIVGQDN